MEEDFREEKDYEHPVVIEHVGVLEYEDFLNIGEKRFILKYKEPGILVPGEIIDFKYKVSERDPSISVSKIREISEEEQAPLEKVIRERKGFQGLIVFGNG
ncbi:MAG: hypothetical protein KJ767_03210 [Nanoarchaeota archaeon]|nr:hypothetical protein [Nanoarchaeota archaeon]